MFICIYIILSWRYITHKEKNTERVYVHIIFTIHEETRTLQQKRQPPREKNK